MLAQKQAKANPIAILNDHFRKHWYDPRAGQVMFTCGVRELAQKKKLSVQNLMEQVASYSAFTQDNDPYQEHDFAAIEVAGQKLFWKIDYYDLDLQFGSENPANPNVTRRVLTLMLAEEY